MKKTTMQKYARLIARKGINVQKNQEVIVNASLDQPEFVKMVVEECYRAGAKKVTVEWSYQPLTKLNYRYRSMKTLSTIEKWEEEKLAHRCDVLPAMIYIDSDDPDGLKGIDQNKVSKASQARYPVLKPYIDKMENKYQWCIAAVPGEAWAKKVFPGERVGKAVEKLWDAILYTSRADGEDPVKAWENHNADTIISILSASNLCIIRHLTAQISQLVLFRTDFSLVEAKTRSAVWNSIPTSPAKKFSHRL